MHFPVRTSLALGLMLALGATDAHAWWGKKKEQAPAAAPAAAAPVPAVPETPPPPPPPQMIYPGDPAVAPVAAQTDLLQTAPAEVLSTLKWVIASRDHRGAPFVMVDKPSAQAFAFNGAGQLLAVAPVLMGMAKGDQMLVPNAAPMSAIPPQKRITPAGRWWARLAPDATGKEVLVIDHAAALSLHPIVPGQPHEKRATRIATATPDDNRVSFGCINAPKAFFSNVISTAFAGKMGVVYILPETRTAASYYGFQPDVATPAAPQVSTAMGTAAPAAAPSSQAVPATQPAPTQAVPAAPAAAPAASSPGTSN